MQEGSST
jgi:hypothetical protein